MFLSVDLSFYLFVTNHVLIKICLNPTIFQSYRMKIASLMSASYVQSRLQIFLEWYTWNADRSIQVYRIVVGVSCIEDERIYSSWNWLQASNTKSFPCTHTADKSITVKPVMLLSCLVCLLCTKLSSILLLNHRFKTLHWIFLNCYCCVLY